MISNNEYVLRPLRANDASKYYAAVIESAKSLQDGLVLRRPTYTLEEARKWIEFANKVWNSQHYIFALTDKQDHLLGSLDIKLEATHGTIGYWIRSQQQRKGVCTNSLKLLMEFAFRNLNFDYVEFIIANHNLPSLRVIAKFNATPVRNVPNFARMNNKTYAAVVYRVNKSDVIK
jgi:ribosomal-protein-serine acetyltransferase